MGAEGPAWGAPDRREAVILESLDLVHAVGERIALGRRHLDGPTAVLCSCRLSLTTTLPSLAWLFAVHDLLLTFGAFALAVFHLVWINYH